jgi:hypothetical protein
MVSERSRKWLVGIGLFVLLCITVMGLFIPHDLHEIQYSEINKYRMIWTFWGIMQIILTITLTYLIISFFSKNTVSKVEYYAQVIVMLCIAVMWLLIVLPPVKSFLKKTGKITYLKAADVGKDRPVHDVNEKP